jgi:uncharacterized protein
LIKRIADPFQLRATMPVIILMLSAIAIGAVGLSGGLQHAQLWCALVVVLPFALAGIGCGNWLAKKLDSSRWPVVIYSLLAASGAMLSVGALRRLVS